MSQTFKIQIIYFDLHSAVFVLQGKIEQVGDYTDLIDLGTELTDVEKKSEEISTPMVVDKAEDKSHLKEVGREFCISICMTPNSLKKMCIVAGVAKFRHDMSSLMFWLRVQTVFARYIL